ncbi:MAG: hypothetical protein K8I00_03630 [Candidatus Omnitrophica bacterium]|nr:hypothetical protein [Candidatus Omnitrophota bacterium]
MTRMTRIFVAMCMVVMLMAVPGWADETGEPGFIESLELVSISADNYPLYHGEMILQTEFGEVAYRWGGSSCPGKDLNHESNTHMLDALIQYSQSAHMHIVPTYKNGQGGNLCVVSFVATSNAASCCKTKGKLNDSLIDARLKGKKILQN